MVPSDDDVVQIRIFLDARLMDSLLMTRLEMREIPDLALDFIRRRAEQVLVGQVDVKRIVYEDEEGDSCTLTAPSFSDALDLCNDGVLRLQVVPGPGEGTTTAHLTPKDLMEELRTRCQGLNPRKMWYRVGEAGLELLSELQGEWQDDWAELIQPLNNLASGSLDADGLMDLGRLALELYQKMDGKLQCSVKTFALQAINGIEKELSQPLVKSCSSCGCSVASGQLCVFCAGDLGLCFDLQESDPSELVDAKPLRLDSIPETEAGGLAVESSVVAAAMSALLQHPDEVVRAAAQGALVAARGEARSDTSSDTGWELVPDILPELEPFIPEKLNDLC